jgi:signal-transduction protein with cAMP-binding, CBS, and nucleotidyltransferase domain
MSETDSITDAIQASLANFTHRLEDVSSDQFKEMRKCSFFDPIPSKCLAEIAKEAEVKSFAAGEHITDEGDRMDAFHVLMYGTATVFFNNKVVGAIRSGECIGEGTFFGNETFKRSATVITDGEAIVVEIRKSVVDKMEGEIKSYMDKALLLALFRKLQAANKKIGELLRDKENYQGLSTIPISIPN